MKILILTSRFGMGHQSAAEAVKDELLASGSKATIEIVDIMTVLFPLISNLIYGLFNFFICNFPGMFNGINSHVSNNENSLFIKRATKKINSLINNQKPDLIIATWSAASRYVSDYKNIYEDSIPLYTYITDVQAHDGWITNGTDLYFVAGEPTKELLISKGISSNKIIINGIPVRQCFKKASLFKDEIALTTHNTKKEILIMGGGLGIIPDLNDILENLCKTDSIHITVITGKNKKLYKLLKEEYPEIEVIGYTKEVYKYMQRSDLLITKPGGISTFEAIYCSTPLYVMNPILSQEIGNAMFIEKMHLGKIVWKNNINLSKDIINLVNNNELLNEYKSNMELIRNEITDSKLKNIFERNVKINVADFSDDYYPAFSNDLWASSYFAIQSVK
ncbi:MAG: glycosyltransferase [Clostridium sp.]|nr:glycosyltransferase [Clostridium sp.]MDU7083655.1 glycosyltransferase [Clostridium sp.]